MNRLVWRELAVLLSRLGFTHEDSDYGEGRHWAVYAHPWAHEDRAYFDALITVTPRSPEASMGQGLRLTVRRNNAIWLTSSVTNGRGQVWFARLPAGSTERFTARLEDVQEGERGEAAFVRPSFAAQAQAPGERVRAAAAAAVRTRGGGTPPWTPQILPILPA